MSQNELEAILKKIRNISTSKLNLVGASDEETKWDDDRFKSQYLVHGMAKMTKRPDMTSGVKTAVKFLEWYLGISEPSSSEVFINTYYTILSLVKIKADDYLIKEGTQTPEAFNLPDDFNITSYVFMGHTVVALSVEDAVCDLQTVKNFAAWVNKWKGKTETRDAQDLLNMVGFLMLNLLRLGPKTAAEVSCHVVRRVSNTYRSLFSNIDIVIPPPSETYYRHHFNALNENRKEIKYLRAVLVWQFKTESSEAMKGVFRAGLMLALADNGLGLVSWPVKAAKKLHVELSTYLDRCSFNNNCLDQANRLTSFLEENVDQITWPYCRLFESSAYNSMSTSRNPDLCIISALIEMEDPQKVRDLKQFKTVSAMVSRMTLLAQEVKDTIRSHKNEKQSMRQSKHVDKRLELRPSRALPGPGRSGETVRTGFYSGEQVGEEGEI